MAQPSAGKPGKASEAIAAPRSGGRIGSFRPRGRWDPALRHFTRFLALITVALIPGIAVILLLASRTALTHTGLHLLTTTWTPFHTPSDGRTGDVYGILPLVYGTLVTSVLALALAVPLGIGAAIYLAEIAPRRISAVLTFLIETFAVIPGVVYGFWALLYLVPPLQTYGEPWLIRVFGRIPFFLPPTDPNSGLCYLSAGLILALMILPFLTVVSRDLLHAIPTAQREAVYHLSATRWEGIRTLVVRHAGRGIVGAILLGLGRAIGESIAVTMLIGSSVRLPVFRDASGFSLFRPGCTLTSVLADQFPHPNTALHASALAMVALTLFIITLLVNGTASVLVRQSARHGTNASSALVLAADTGAPPANPCLLRWKQFRNVLSQMLCSAAALISYAALLTMLYFVVKEGSASFDMRFFAMPEQGGMLPAIVGTGFLVLLASIPGIPIGVSGGHFLARFGDNRLGSILRLAADLLIGMPSIIVGIFAYLVFVVPTHANQGVAGGFALSILLFPRVMRATEEHLRRTRPEWKPGTTGAEIAKLRSLHQYGLPMAKGGLVSGVLFSIAQIVGEAAPLLMIGSTGALGNSRLPAPSASLPTALFILREAGTDHTLRQCWSVALLLIMLILVLHLTAHLLPLTSRSQIRTKTFE